MNTKQRFSIRKYKLGAVSVLLGTLFFLGGITNVAADSVINKPSDIAVEQQVKDSPTSIANETPTNNTSSALASTAQDNLVTKANNNSPTETQPVTEPHSQATETFSPAANQPVESTQEVSKTPLTKQNLAVKPTPAISKETPQNIDSNKIITVPKVWNTGYKGEGTVVAIIDSGLDTNHDALQLNDSTKAKYQNEQQMNAAKAKAGINYGKWYNNKVIFGHNYVDVNTELKEVKSTSHGMHVTSIATANPSKKDTNELIYGVAPEAQVMFMRVFSDEKRGTGPALYVKAIEDAVKLGADSINLSLGGANGSLVNADDRLIKALEMARLAGVSVVIAAGNDGTFGSGASKPSALYPDYGLVGSPSTAREAISVASYNNTTLVNKVFNIIGLENNKNLNNGLAAYADPKVSDKTFEVGKQYDYVFVGKGNDNDYKDKTLNGKIALIELSGTSMASPHVAGATALVKQYLLKEHPELKKGDIERTVKYLLMSTAKAHLNKDTGAYTSPRQQGAGIIDVAAAVQTGLYLTGGENNYGSVTLGNIKDKISFDVTVHNINKVAKDLHYTTYLNTDQVKDGFVTLAPQQLGTFTGKTIRIEPGQTKTITIDIDVSKYHDMLKKVMPNGYFLEGYVRFTDPVDGGEVLSIPYVGFKGEFQNLEVLEKSIYKLVANKEKGFYFQPKQTNEVPGSEDYTALMTTSSEPIYSTDGTSPIQLKALGSYKSIDGKWILQLEQKGQPHLAISPNDDQNQDAVALKGVFLRNFNNLRAKVYRADDVNLQKPLWVSAPQAGDKNYYSGNTENPKSTFLYDTEWKGTTTDGIPLEDGKYKYVLTYYSDVPGSKPQQMVFDITLDRQAPTLTTATYDKDRRIFKARPAVEHGESGIFREQVFYLKKDKDGHYNSVLRQKGEDGILVEDNKVFIKQEKDGSFILPKEVNDFSHVYYTVEDYAGNLVSAKLEDLINIGNKNGLVNVKVFSPELNSNVDIDFSYSVKDDKGNVIKKQHHGKDLNLLKLPFGTYTFDLFLYDEERANLISPQSVTVTISEKDSLKDVLFKVNLLKKAALLVEFDKLLPKGATVQLVTKTNTVVDLPKATYSPTDYGKNIPVGDYRLNVTLPSGYSTLENLDDLLVSVKEGQVNLTKLTLINKAPLINALAEQTDIISQPVFYNAGTHLKNNYLANLEKAQTLIKNRVEQTSIDNAIAALRESRQALNGKETDTSLLAKAILAETEIKGNYQFVNASPLSQSTYINQVQLAKNLLQKPNVTQSEVDKALENLDIAKNQLNGHETDYSGLHHMIIKANVLKQTSSKYQNASQFAKENYNNLIKKAELLLSNRQATQAQVEELLNQIKATEQELDGRDRVSSAENYSQSLNDNDSLNTTPINPPNQPQALIFKKGMTKESEVAQKRVLGVTSQTDNQKIKTNKLPKTGESTPKITYTILLFSLSMLGLATIKLKSIKRE
ncbi:TPA: S8 family serine peptidase [Streptococcus agalactiae]